MIVWSWIDWNTTMELRPYDFRPRSATPFERFVEHSERFRLYADIAIVTLYAYVLFQVAPLVGHSDADMRYLLLGYPIVFALYLISGFLRIILTDRRRRMFARSLSTWESSSQCSASTCSCAARGSPSSG